MNRNKTVSLFFYKLFLVLVARLRDVFLVEELQVIVVLFITLYSLLFFDFAFFDDILLDGDGEEVSVEAAMANGDG